MQTIFVKRLGARLRLDWTQLQLIGTIRAIRVSLFRITEESVAEVNLLHASPFFFTLFPTPRGQKYFYNLS